MISYQFNSPCWGEILQQRLEISWAWRTLNQEQTPRRFSLLFLFAVGAGAVLTVLVPREHRCSLNRMVSYDPGLRGYLPRHPALIATEMKEMHQVRFSDNGTR